jgi:hypothetical protein
MRVNNWWVYLGITVPIIIFFGIWDLKINGSPFYFLFNDIFRALGISCLVYFALDEIEEFLTRRRILKKLKKYQGLKGE